MKTKSKILSRFTEMKIAALAALAITALVSTPALAGNSFFEFNMVRNNAGALQNALPNAHGHIKIESVGSVEIMDVIVSGLSPNTDFDFFVIQVPKAPFGLSWYQGDIETDDHGSGVGDFTGRFNQETFIVAPGPAPAPVLHHSPIPDAETNPPTGPVHTFH